jgi:hypothetical protein
MFVSCLRIPADGFIGVLRHGRLFFIETNRLTMSGLWNSNVQPAARVINITTILYHNYHYTLQKELASLRTCSLYANLSNACYQVMTTPMLQRKMIFILIVPFGGYCFSMFCATWGNFVEDVIEHCFQLVGLTSKNMWMCRYSLNR